MMQNFVAFRDSPIIPLRRSPAHCASLPFSFTLKGPENLVREIRTMRRKRWRRRRWEKQRTNGRTSGRRLKLAFRSLARKQIEREREREREGERERGRERERERGRERE